MSSGFVSTRTGAAGGEAGEHAERFEIVTERTQALITRLERTSAELDEARDQIANLEQALQSSRRIGMAVGILMARRHLDADAAFLALREASQRLHRKVRDVADEVVFTGELPAA